MFFNSILVLFGHRWIIFLFYFCLFVVVFVFDCCGSDTSVTSRVGDDYLYVLLYTMSEKPSLNDLKNNVQVYMNGVRIYKWGLFTSAYRCLFGYTLKNFVVISVNGF